MSTSCDPATNYSKEGVAACPTRLLLHIFLLEREAREDYREKNSINLWSKLYLHCTRDG